MRVASIAVQCALLAGIVAARDAYLYTFDHSPRTSSVLSSTISSEAAALIVARRRGITEEEVYLGGFEEHVLEQISYNSGYQQLLFEEGKGPAPRGKLLIRITGYDDDAPEESTCHLKVTKPGSELGALIIPANEKYAAFETTESCLSELWMDSGVGGVEDIYTTVDIGLYRLITDFFTEREGHLLGKLSQALQRLSESAKGESHHLRSTLPQVLEILQELAGKESIESTLVLLPSQNTMANTNSLSRRGEEPLDLPSVEISSPSQPLYTYASNFTIPSNLPACFSSKSACENATNSCLGHGSCSPSHGSSSCYKCHCISTVIRENEDGSKKTQQWGGLACQKKDVSVPFFLFASFGVAMMALVYGAIGMLYSMGGQELPSVIGAGVAGPRAQK